MGLRCRQHVNPLGISFGDFRGERPRLSPGRPVELEVGCADALFLLARARANPERTYVGLEIREPLVEQVNRHARAEGLPVQAIFCHANLHIAELFSPASVARVYLNFPDPWFKRRHQKRRLIDERLCRDLHRLLEPGGEVFFQSDVWDLALDALAVFEGADDRFENLAGPWSFWKPGNPFGARSGRERACEEEGRAIWRLRFCALPKRQVR